MVLTVSACKVSASNALYLERVIDGDTFIASGTKIRLWGVNAPEKNEPESFTSTKYLEVLLEEGTLTCDFLYKDRYQRSVMQCFSDGKDIAWDMVKMGMARDYPKYSEGYYSKAEQEAKDMRAGIWSGAKI